MPTIDRDRVTPAIRNLGLRNESAVLIAVRETSHTEVGRRINWAKQTFQDWRDEHLKDACLIFAAYGLKLVPSTTDAYSSDDIAAMSHLAQKGLISIKPLRSNGGTVVEEEADTAPGELGER